MFGSGSLGEKCACFAKVSQDSCGSPSCALHHIIHPASGDDIREKSTVDCVQDGVEDASRKVVGATDTRDDGTLGAEGHAHTIVVAAEDAREKLDEHFEDECVGGKSP